jgi:hypothetical protein
MNSTSKLVKIKSGGQSSIYKIKNNNSKLLRKITIKNQNNLEKEIKAINIINTLIEKYNFINLLKYEIFDLKNPDSQIIEKMDGDLEDFKHINGDYNNYKDIIIQCIMTIIFLTKHKLYNFDIKPQNFLYKTLEKPIIITYQFDDVNFSLLTHYLIKICDYGKIFNINNTKHKYKHKKIHYYQNFYNLELMKIKKDYFTFSDNNLIEILLNKTELNINNNNSTFFNKIIKTYIKSLDNDIPDKDKYTIISVRF